MPLTAVTLTGLQPYLLSSPRPHTLSLGPHPSRLRPRPSLRSCPHCGCPEGPPPGQSHRLCARLVAVGLAPSLMQPWVADLGPFPGPSCCALCPCRPGPAPQAISGVGANLLDASFTQPCVSGRHAKEALGSDLSPGSTRKRRRRRAGGDPAVPRERPGGHGGRGAPRRQRRPRVGAKAKMAGCQEPKAKRKRTPEGQK